MTAKKEDYVKTIYLLGGDTARINNKRVSRALHVSAASVSEMLVKLSKEGMIEYVPYRGVRLTPAGIAAALVLVRNHVLWETFLIRFLGYSSQEAEAEAEALSHATTAKLADRLDAYLEYPLNHGKAAEDIVASHEMSLKEVPPGQTVRITGADDDTLHTLHELGLDIGSSIKLMMSATPDNALIIEYNRRTLFIDGTSAENLMVEA